MPSLAPGHPLTSSSTSCSTSSYLSLVENLDIQVLEMRANACPELAEEGVVCYVGEGQAGEQGFDDNDDGGDDDGGSSGGDGGDDDS